jgi:7-cyano-7-deazaguanine reductase
VGRTGYSAEHARAGLSARLPAIDVFPNQFPGYEITVVDPEFTSICPKTGLPDFGTITIVYTPSRLVLELKSLKLHLHAYRNLGIFQENAVNRVLREVVRACRPRRCLVRGEFRPRGGLHTRIEARFPRK